MSSQLASLTNGDLRPAGVTIDDVKAEMVRLGQLRSQPGLPDQLYVYVRVSEPAGLALARPFFLQPPDEAPGWNLLAGWIEEDRLADVAILPQVLFVQAVDPPRFRAGSVTTAGDVLHNGPQARSAPLGLDGSGIRVGVISDGVSNLASAQGSGDLPPAVNVLMPGTGDEGTAMLEIVHDLAPGASLDFCAAGSNKIAFGNSIAALHAAGCNVICDDVGWYDDPFFEHSPIGMQIAAMQSMRDYLHVSAAGNDAQLHHQQVFTDSHPAPGGDGWHDPYLIVSIPPNGVLDAFMQWKEAQPVPPATLASDYDLYLADYYTSSILAQSLTRNRVGETIYYTNNTGLAITAALYVYRYSGSTAHHVEIFIEPQNGAVQYTNSTSPVDAIFGHPGYGSVLSAVATDVTSPSAIEWDSSQGPFTILGMLQPWKPDVAAADGGAVSGAGGFATPFFGTSAAAPHVAGVLALVWNRSPGVPAAALRSTASLLGGCTDLGTPGFDNVLGWGRPLADQWANLLNQPPTIDAPSATVQCAQLKPEVLSSVVVSDPDSAANSLVLTLSVSGGIIQVNPAVPGGVTPPQITANGTPTVTVTAPVAAIQTTLSAADGLTYSANFVPPGSTVADALMLGVNDQGYSGLGGALSGSGSVSLLAHEFAYEAWRYDHFDALQLANPVISGDLASPDGDLHGNAWEYFMGSDPWVPDSEPFPSVAVNSGYLVFTFRVSKDHLASTYAVQASQDLINWTDVPLAEITVPWPQHPTVPDAWLMEVKHPLTNGRDFLHVDFDPRR